MWLCGMVLQGHIFIIGNYITNNFMNIVLEYLKNGDIIFICMQPEILSIWRGIAKMGSDQLILRSQFEIMYLYSEETV